MRRNAPWQVAASGVVLLCSAALGLLHADRAESATTFTQIVVDPANSGDCKAVGDVNGDGLADGFHGGFGELVWYQSPGGSLAGPWTKHVMGTAINEFTTFCVAADVDRDGAVDIVVPDNGTMWWFRNPRGSGGDPAQLWQRNAIATTPTYFTHDVRVGDLTGDGRPDVVGRASGVTTVWTQGATSPQGVISWTPQVINNLNGEGLSLGDVDGDGLLDVVVGGYWHHSPDWTRRTINGSTNSSSYVADMNGDGRSDVVLASMESSSQPVTYWTNSAPMTGSWTSHTVDPVARDGGHNIEVRDFDGDGRLDVLVPRMFGEVAINWNGAGGWTRTVLSSQGGHNLSAGDMNGDGAPEVFGGNYAGNPPVWVWRNGGGAGTTTTTAPTTTTTTTTPTTTTTTTPTTTTTTTAPPSTPVRHEAENGVITAGMDPYDDYWCPCSNGRAVGDFAEAGESITWTVTSPKAGQGSLAWRYGAGTGAVTRRLTVNGTLVGNVHFPKTNGWGNWRTVKVTVTLRAGANTIRLAAPSGSARYLNVDYMDVTTPR